MSETKRFFTAIFELTPAFYEGNPMTTDTPWGRAICVSIGDVTHQAEIYEDKLSDIADDGCMRCAEAAQKAIDEGAAYVHSQIDRKSLKPMSPPSETEQLDLGGQG